MNFRILFPRLLALGFALSLSATAMAQSSEADPRPTNTTLDATGSKRLETDISLPKTVTEVRPRTVGARPDEVTSETNVRGAAIFNQLLLTAIESHLGAFYRYNHTGPDSFDCSGFVWRAFQEAGINFTRGPARSYWATMIAPTKEDQFKFGNLVFFSGLTHVGIVADEKGFYHSSRHHGVVYSKFDDYWLSRIDGFRRVPSQPGNGSTVSLKSRAAKTEDTLSLERANPR